MIFFILALLSSISFGENESPPPTSAESQMEQAFQREYAYLAAQREALVRQRKKIDAQTAGDLSKAKQSMQTLNSRLANLQSNNEELFTRVQEEEKIKRDERNRADQLQNLWRKSNRALEETKRALRFESGKSDTDLIPPDELTASNLATIGTEALTLAQDASKLVRFKGAYLNEADHLVESALYRLGRVAVYAQQADGVKLLGPDGKGALKEVDSDKDGSAQNLLAQKEVGSVPVYLFQSMQERLSIKKTASLTDHLADAVPVIFLAILFLMVAFLFFQLARV